jgi:uncharacterized damage-inducible protein DinB
MPLSAVFLPEFDHEMRTTRALLERVPENAAAWKPHPKSFSLGELAEHVSSVVRYGAATLQLPELDFASPANARFKTREFTTTRQLVERFDENVRDTRAALSAVTDADFKATWTLRVGDRTVFSLPRSAALRSFIFSHLIHHRGQLSVYLRLRDVPLPPIYGPTADER